MLLVLVRHLAICPGETSILIRRAQEYLHRGGWVGVDLFFVLSGFLISGLLFTEHKKDGVIGFKNFIIRRGFKIYPGFWVMILLTLLLYSIDGNESKKYLPFEILFIQNYFPGFWGHTWTLAVEEHFYIGLPLLLIVVYRFTGGRAIIRSG